MAQILLDNKCDPNKLNNKSQSPLMIALETGNFILVDYLINKAKIDKLEATVGLGIPLNKVNLNVGYGYGIHGLQKNVSIKENEKQYSDMIDEWKAGFIQTDDILVVGFEL